MSISDYEKTIYNMRNVPLKRTKEVEERLMTALEMANAQLGSIIGRTDNPLSIKVYQGKRMQVVQMMNELGISLKRDITSAISEIANDVAFTEQDATNDLLLENDDANLMVDFTEIPRQTADLLAQRYDVDGLRISSSIWAQSQVSEIENVVLSGIARGQSARDMSNQLSQFMLGGGTGMGTSVRAKAMRLARTEINNAYWESARRASIESPVVKGIRWELSARHPKYDVCDLLANENLFGLGAGVYPAEYLPAKPHPNCLCYQIDILRDVDEWDEPKKQYSSQDLERTVDIARQAKVSPMAVGSEKFKAKQLQLFINSVANATGQPLITLTPQVVSGLSLKEAVQLEIDKGLETAEDYIRVGNLIHDDLRVAYTEEYNRFMAKPKHLAANKLHYTLSSDPNNELAQIVKNTIAKVRPVGADGQKHDYVKYSNREIKNALDLATELMPTDWVRASIENPSKIQARKNNARGYYLHGTSYSDLASETYSWSMNSTVLHEFGHRVEYVVDGIRKIEKEFYDRRTQGESLEWLGKGYGRDEKTRKDEFTDKYMGKYYPDAFEILSMGLEGVFYGQYGLQGQDQEYFNLILGLLAAH